MAIGYTVYQFSAFPKLGLGEVQTVPHNEYFSLAEESYVDRPMTRIIYTGRVEGTDIEAYKVIYEKKINKAGRARAITFPWFIETREFFLFYQRSSGVGLLKVAKEVAHGAMNELSKFETIKGSCRKISVDSIRKRVQELKAAWVRGNGTTTVRSQAFFGDNVDRAPQFEEATKSGSVFNIRFYFPFRDDAIYVGVSELSNVFIVGSPLYQPVELALVLQIKKDILDPADDAPVRK